MSKDILQSGLVANFAFCRSSSPSVRSAKFAPLVRMSKECTDTDVHGAVGRNSLPFLPFSKLLPVLSWRTADDVHRPAQPLAITASLTEISPFEEWNASGMGMDREEEQEDDGKIEDAGLGGMRQGRLDTVRELQALCDIYIHIYIYIYIYMEKDRIQSRMDVMGEPGHTDLLARGAVLECLGRELSKTKTV